MSKLSFSVSLSVLPLPFIFGPVRPNLYSIAMTLATQPLPRIDHSILKFDRIFLYLDFAIALMVVLIDFYLVEVVLVLFGEARATI